MRPAIDILHAWLADDPIPGGWEIDVDEGPEGGQPNGIGEIEPSDAREWFSEMGETHHRARVIVTVTGPWESGPRPSVARYQELERERRERIRLREEDRVLAEAARIQARKGIR